jgi:aconitate hydratase
MVNHDPFGAHQRLKIDSIGSYYSQPWLESLLRNCDGGVITLDHVLSVANWQPQGTRQEIPFKPARVILQDFTGVPALVDLAAMRDAMKQLGGDPKKITTAGRGMLPRSKRFALIKCKCLARVSQKR